MAKIIVNNQLIETSSEEASKLSGQTPVITPLGTAVGGGTEDQAKMAGTKAQKQPVLEAAVKPQTTLREVERKPEVRQELTQVERETADKANKLRQFGYLESRVDDLIKQRMQLPVTETLPTPALQINESKIASLSAETQGPARNALTRYSQAVASGDTQTANQALAEFNQLVAQTGVPENISSWFGGVETTAGQQIQAQVAARPVTLGEIGVAPLGLSEQELAQVLGEGWQQMTIPQVQEAVQRYKQTEFNRAENLKAELGRADVAPARRQQILSELRDLGALGVVSAEQQVADTVRAIEEADQINFNGQQMSVEELLGSNEISNAVENYLALPVGNPAKEEMAKRLGPEFVAWVESHADALKQLGGVSEKTAEQFAELQQRNQQAMATQAGNISDKLMADMFGENWKSFAATDYQAELANLNWYQALQDQNIPVEQRNAFLGALNSVPLDEEFAEELKGLSAGQVQQLLKNPKGLQDYMRYRAQAMSPEQFTEEQTRDIDFLLDYMFGKDVDPQDVKQEINQMKVAAKVDPKAASAYNKYKKLLDNYGNLDSAKILDYLKSEHQEVPAESVEQFADTGKIPASQYKEMIGTDAYKESQEFASIYNLKDKYGNPLNLLNDSSLNKKDVNQIIDKLGIDKALNILSNSQIFGYMDLKTRDYVDTQLTNYNINQLTEVITPDVMKKSTLDKVLKLWSDKSSTWYNNTTKAIESGVGVPLNKQEYTKLKGILSSLDQKINLVSGSTKKYLQNYRDKILTVLKQTEGYVKNIKSTKGFEKQVADSLRWNEDKGFKYIRSQVTGNTQLSSASFDRLMELSVKLKRGEIKYNKEVNNLFKSMSTKAQSQFRKSFDKMWTYTYDVTSAPEYQDKVNRYKNFASSQLEEHGWTE